MGDETIPLQFASLYDFQEVFVWSDCLLDLGMDFLIGNMVFACIILRSSAVRVQIHKHTGRWM